MDNHRVIYSKLNLPPNPKNQERKSKGNKSSILVTEQEITYVELSLQTASQDLLDNDKTFHSKDLPSPPKKITAEILAITCIVLMASVLKTIVLISFNVILEQNNYSLITRTQKETYCCSCTEEWLAYSNSCYYIGKERKTWEESMMVCASMNSSLLYIDDEEEMKLLSSLVREAWIGVSRNSSDHPWVSITGSMFKYK
ncbi:NKG2-A/NKG2-B type II integral membrane protein-like [Carlito syrichta]|uniref:NKG2-A/NKG2-B type II integral membrane protein-like n=1 Tax=Carlito syrichta TaxID=1868482 RepID=A0A1U7UMW5_CARSF|nr:NKG2-A/NKG2-B type II integral membrane protein-like [Carlito syrichta]